MSQWISAKKVLDLCIVCIMLLLAKEKAGLYTTTTTTAMAATTGTSKTWSFYSYYGAPRVRRALARTLRPGIFRSRRASLPSKICITSPVSRLLVWRNLSFSARLQSLNRTNRGSFSSLLRNSVKKLARRVILTYTYYRFVVSHFSDSHRLTLPQSSYFNFVNIFSPRFKLNFSLVRFRPCTMDGVFLTR